MGFSLLLLNHLFGICLPAASCNSPADNQGAASSVGKKFPSFSSSVSEEPTQRKVYKNKVGCKHAVVCRKQADTTSFPGVKFYQRQLIVALGE